jgi:SNF2 family DNA or RNA helicase
MFYTDTIEEVIDEVIDRKRKLADIAVVGTESPDVEKSDIVRALSISPATRSFKRKVGELTN